MSLPAILIGLALLLLTAPFVFGPLRERRKLEPPADDPLPDVLPDRREQTMWALRDLDFDHQLGVIAEDDYSQLRPQLLAQAAQAFEETANPGADLDARIEAAVRAHRLHKDAGMACRQCNAALRPGDRYCPKCGARAGRVCPRCSLPLVVSDRFCPGCGVPVASQEGVAV